MFFSTAEKKGVLVLLFLITALFLLPRQFLARDCDLFLLPEVEETEADTQGFLKSPDGQSADFSPRIRSYKKKTVIVELNAADSLQLVKIKGIGPYYAIKILRYRERLGGFYSVNQLKEVKMTYFNVDSATCFFQVNPQLIHKRNLDTMSFKAMLRHPYLEYEDVQLIFNAKRKFGTLSYQLLEEQKVLPAYKLKKIKPYFQ